MVQQVPVDGQPMSEFVVRHEEIPHFVSNAGALGMEVMSMPFPVGEHLDLSGVEPGQKITLTFTVDYDEQQQKLLGYRATRVEPLPDDTQLYLDPPAAPSGTESDTGTEG